MDSKNLKFVFLFLFLILDYGHLRDSSAAGKSPFSVVPHLRLIL